ncbi:MAG: hypothetical protein ACI9A1_000757 [Lentimonas sp.]|jgi:hypothetical protein
MPALLKHACGVMLQPFIRIVTATLDDTLVEFGGQFEVERVFAGSEELMVVHVALPPCIGPDRAKYHLAHCAACSANARECCLGVGCGALERQ